MKVLRLLLFDIRCQDVDSSILVGFRVLAA